MGLRKPKEVRERTRAERRAAMLPTQELLDWADQSLYTMAKYLSQYRAAPDETVLLQEALIGAEALQAVLAEVSRRTLTTSGSMRF